MTERTRTQTKLLEAGVRNLVEFGYAEKDVTPETIISERVFALFFKSMLEESLGQGADADVRVLLAEIEKAHP